MKKLIILMAVALVGICGAKAQDVPSHCVAFTVSAPRGCDDMTDAQRKTLELKCLQILTRNNASRTAFYNAFTVFPTVDIIDERTVVAGTADITVVEGEFTLVAENVVDQSRYGSVVVKLEGSGSTRAKAYNSMLQSITPTAGVFTGFIKKSTDQIVKYYSQNMGKVLNLAQTLIAAEQYQDAANVLCSIPFCVPSFDQSLDAINGLFKMIADKDCRSALEMANRYVASGYYAEAEEVLHNVKPGSTCASDVQSLLEQIKAKKNEDTKPAN